jgi:hypothetical protein
MRTVYKYDVPVVDRFQLELPAGAELLCVDVQDEEGYLWALVEPTSVAQTRTFIVRGTGQPIEEGTKYAYVGSFFPGDGMYVFHVLEVLS